jgi:hypothetical protein
MTRKKRSYAKPGRKFRLKRLPRKPERMNLVANV